MSRRPVLVALAVVAVTVGLAPEAAASPIGHHQPTAEIFATDNTATITDPNDPRLKDRLVAFGAQVRGIIATNGSWPGCSTLLDGVFWSDDLKTATYERSREFDVDHVSAGGLHHIASVIRKQYQQESVLTFQYLPQPGADSVEVEVPGVTVQQLFNGLAADPVLREELGGGSVTADGGRLALIADKSELASIREFVGVLGANWSKATVAYGHLEFVAD
ncbi:hypothetical protein [Kutzneria sp. NPDC051319]|uniref:hypothetical protein n=1 Tax=Kutzneria sp. NPDC051319 TaxID=3155047 RepID=UPI0034379362